MAAVRTSVRKLAIQDSDYWKSCGVYTKNIQDTLAQHLDAAIKLVAKSNKANLIYVCNTFGIANDPDDGLSKYVECLIRAFDKTIIYLCNFAKKRGESIREQYHSTMSSTKQGSVTAQISVLGKGKDLSPSILTMLVLLYDQDPEQLIFIYNRSHWRGKETFYEFVTDARITSSSIAKLESKSEEIEKSLVPLNDDKEVRFVSARKLNPNLFVFLIQRKYSRTMREDYDKDFSPVTPYGNLIFGIDLANRKIIFKIKNQKIKDAILQWIEKTLESEFKATGLKLHSSYDAGQVQQALLGGYDPVHEIEISNLKIRRSAAPYHSTITMDTRSGYQNIRADLAWLREKGVAAITSLSDLEQIGITFRGQNAVISINTEKTGLVRFKHVDVGWDEEHQTALQTAFQKCFGLPLNQPIDPRPLMLGHLEVYKFLLSCKNRNEVEPFQREAYKELKESGILDEEVVETKMCKSFGCDLKDKEIHIEDQTQCLQCHTKLETVKITLIHQNKEKIQEAVSEALVMATGLKLSKKAETFETFKFDTLEVKGKMPETVYMCFRNQLGEQAKDLLTRFAQPVLIVHTTGQNEYNPLEMHGIAHISLAYILASIRDDDAKEKFKIEIIKQLSELKRSLEARVIRAAEESYRVLIEDLKSSTGQTFETDKFNLLRYLFPNTSKWGGGDKPDGISSIVYFKDNDLSKPIKFNWSYDTKLTDDEINGYDLNVGEKRKIWDYIEAMSGKSPFNREGNKLNAHVIITNNIKKVKCKNAVKFVRKSHRLGDKYPDLILGFIRHEFVIRLYERVSSQPVDFHKRQNLLTFAVCKKLSTPNEDGFSWLDNSTADDIADWVLEQPEIESTIDHDLLMRNMANKEFS